MQHEFGQVIFRKHGFRKDGFAGCCFPLLEGFSSRGLTWVDYINPDASKLNLRIMSLEALKTTFTFSVSVAHVTWV